MQLRSNRTFMELKLVRDTGRYDESSRSNRTFMELKYYIITPRLRGREF